MNEDLRESINRIFIHRLGMSYDEFERLDCDEQQLILNEYHRRNPQKKSDEVLVMIGSGENAIFVKKKRGERYLVTSGDSSYFAIAGETVEDQMRRIDKTLDLQTKSPIEKVKQKIKSLRGKR